MGGCCKNMLVNRPLVLHARNADRAVSNENGKTSFRGTLLASSLDIAISLGAAEKAVSES